jgi:L-rhamnose mutarotase
MERLGFTMKLFPGQAEEYKRRHDAIWPALKYLLKDSGISDYSIFLDEASLTLFGVMKVEDAAVLGALREHPVMREWWGYMKDIMETNVDGSPVQGALREVFYLG